VTGARLHPLTLRFDSDGLEDAFREQYARRSLLFVRAALVLAVSQYLLFALFDDVLAPEAAGAVRAIRVVGAAVAALTFAYTFVPSFTRTMQPVLAGTALVGGAGVVGMVWAAQTVSGYYDYYIGLVLVLVYMHVLFRLRFVWASAVGVVLVVAYAAVAVAVETPGPVLLNSVFFEVSALLAGGVASYGLERYARFVFLQERRQRATNAELNAALDRLRAAQTRLVQEQKMAGIGRLASGLAHELMNPLNFVQNFADLDAELAAEAAEALDAGDADGARSALAEVHENAGRVRHHARRADAVVRGLLDHAPESRTLADRRPLDVNAFVAEHAQDVLGAARQRRPGWDCALDFDLDPDAGLAEADPRDLGRVLAAVLHNACDALAHGPTGDGQAAPPVAPAVTVRTRREGGAVVVEVADNGPGIPQDLHGRVFEPFYTTKPPGEGTGLGLSLAYEIVTNGYGGALEVESGEGEGAVFRIRLPVGEGGRGESEQ
jgi:signal transduction histidine kinase